VHSGGPPALSYTKGAPKQFARKDLEKSVTREFCAERGTRMLTRPQRPIVVIKVGTLDDPAQFTPKMAIYTCDKQAFHQCRRACRRSSGCLNVNKRPSCGDAFSGEHSWTDDRL
jgi:hypothetical protein